VPSISLKTKGSFGQKDPFQNLSVVGQVNAVKPAADDCSNDPSTLGLFQEQS
jgi:hypothetical protein